jgi:hypothetical protein
MLPLYGKIRRSSFDDVHRYAYVRDLVTNGKQTNFGCLVFRDEVAIGELGESSENIWVTTLEFDACGFLGVVYSRCKHADWALIGVLLEVMHHCADKINFLGRKLY